MFDNVQDIITGVSLLITAITSAIAAIKGKESRNRGSIINSAMKDEIIRQRLKEMMKDGKLSDDEYYELKLLLNHD